MPNGKWHLGFERTSLVFSTERKVFLLLHSKGHQKLFFVKKYKLFFDILQQTFVVWEEPEKRTFVRKIMISEGHAHLKKKTKKRRPTTYYVFTTFFCQDLNNDHGKAVNGYSSLIVSRQKGLGFLEIYFGRAFGKCRKSTYYYVFHCCYSEENEKIEKKITRISRKNWTWLSTTLVIKHQPFRDQMNES